MVRGWCWHSVPEGLAAYPGTSGGGGGGSGECTKSAPIILNHVAWLVRHALIGRAPSNNSAAFTMHT